MISIALCTCNGAKYIEEQLESIYKQTVVPDEIILCDDKSDDQTVELARKSLIHSGIEYKIVENTSRIKVWKNFSQCISLCSGDIIFTCDQDDVWKNNKIEVFMKYFQNKACVMAYSDAQIVDTDRNILSESLWEVHGFNGKKIGLDQYKKKVLTSMFIAGCSMAFRKDFFEKIAPIPLHFIHDGWIAACAPLFGDIAFIDLKLMEYRRHGSNTSALEVGNTGMPYRRKYARLFHILKMQNWIEWFNNPIHFCLANKAFWDNMNRYMDEEYKKMVKESIMFYESIINAASKGKIDRIRILFHEAKKRRYFIFRGSKKQFLKDLVYVIVHKKEEICDEFVW